MSTPVIDGPIMRPACQGIEPSAMAFGSRSRPTICGHQGHAARLVEGAEGVGERGQRQQVLDARQRERREDEGREQGAGGEGLGDQQQAEAVDPVGEHAAPELEHDQRDALGQAQVAQVERVVGDLPDHPRERQVLRAVAQDVEDEADPVEAIVPLPKGGEGRRGGDGPASQARQGSTRILACRSGEASASKAPATPSTPTRAGDQRRGRDRAVRDVAEGGRELLRRVAQHELEVELLADAEHRVDRVAPPCRRRPRRCGVPLGAAAMIWSSTPGTPTHSKTTAGRSARARDPRGQRGRPARRRATPRPRASSATG